MTVTKEQIGAYLRTVKAVADAIRAAGRMPAGPLYATLMGVMSLDAFERMIGQLVGAGLVQRENNVLTWIGPKE